MLRYLRHIDTILRTLLRRREMDTLRRWGIPPAGLARHIEAIGPAIEPILDEYGRGVSSPDMAVSLHSAVLLAALCELRHPRRVLDAGSGFSSYVLRRFAAGNGDGDAAEVWSVDDNEQWLDATRGYLRDKGLDNERLLPWDQFTRTDEREFDLIFHDLGQTRAVRADTLPEVCARLGPGGLILLDDFHKHSYRARAHEILARDGFEVVPLRHHTLDRFGRYAALARRAA